MNIFREFRNARFVAYAISEYPKCFRYVFSFTCGSSDIFLARKASTFSLYFISIATLLDFRHWY